MRRFAIRLALPLALLIIASQLLIPPFAEDKLADRLTEHGGQADVDLKAVPAVRLLFGHGGKLDLAASGLSVDLDADQRDVFGRLDDFGDVEIDVRDSRAGPFTVAGFRVRKAADRTYDIAIAGDGTAGDVGRYAGSRLAGGFGQALAGLATSALGGFRSTRRCRSSRATTHHRPPATSTARSQACPRDRSRR
jgi:hypothetical protein